jgi:hypothetical protein
MINEKGIRKDVDKIVVTYFQVLSHLPDGLRKTTKYRGHLVNESQKRCRTGSFSGIAQCRP